MSKLVSHENNKAVFTEIVKYEEFEKKIQEAYKKNRSRFNIPGFRKGKATRKLIELNYGKEVFWNDALDLILPEVYVNSIKELNLEPVSRPDVDIETIEEGKDIVLTFTVETLPDPELADYSNIEVEREEINVSESDVEERINQEIEKNKVIKPVDRAVENGDLVNIDFEGYMNDEKFEGGEASNYELKIGSGEFIPGFEEGLIGKKADEEVELNLTFPEEYHEELKGKDVLFKVKINGVKEEVFPELDDDFVMDISEFDTVDEYKAEIRKELENAAKRNADIMAENAMFEEVLKRTPFDIPNQMVEDQIDSEYRDYEHQISHMGIDMETYLKLTNLEEGDVREQLREKAENKVRIDIIIEKMLKESNEEVTDEDIENEYKEVAKDYNKVDDEEFVNLIKAQIRKEDVEVMIKKRRIVESLKENIVYVDKKEEVEEDK